MDYLNQFNWKQYINWSLLFAFLSLGFCALMIYLATWSPSMVYLTNPDSTINYRLIHFIKRGETTFFGVGILGFLLAITFIVAGNLRFIFRIGLVIISALVLLFIVFSPIRVAFQGLLALDLVDQEKVDGATYNLVKIEYFDDPISTYTVVLYRCDSWEFNCHALYSLAMPPMQDFFEDAYRLQRNDNNELILLEDDVEIWSIELSD
ncbi:MAG: hypothetical protein RLP44_31230 [Aggregatilineales bacterium]